MKTKELWRFPVPSAGGIAKNVKLIYPDENANALLLFDYYDSSTYDVTGHDEVFNSGILFDMAQAHRHSSEKFTVSLMDAYDRLVEIVDSGWVAELKKINSQIADFWNIKHYVIFLDSYGLYEFIASDYKILETKKGFSDE